MPFISPRSGGTQATSTMTTFVGLDLAWTSHRETRICWFEGDEPDTLRCVRLEAAVCRVEDLATEVAAVPGPLVVAVDAPLIVTRRRWVEREIGRRFGRHRRPPTLRTSTFSGKRGGPPG